MVFKIKAPCKEVLPFIPLATLAFHLFSDVYRAPSYLARCNKSHLLHEGGSKKFTTIQVVDKKRKKNDTVSPL